MTKDEVWERLKSDATTVYGVPMLEMFLKTTSTLERRHLESLPKSKRSLVPAQCLLDIARNREEVDEAIRRGNVDLEYSMKKAAERGDNAVIDILAEKGAKEFRMALVAAVVNGQADTVDHLLNKGTPVTERSIERAAEKGNLRILDRLVKAAGNKILLDSALFFAASEGKIDVVEYLVGKGAGSRDDALDAAAERGHVDVAEFLIRSGVNHQSSALIGAIINGHDEIIELLIDLGADPEAAIIWASEKHFYRGLDRMMRNQRCLKIARKLARDYPDIEEYLDKRKLLN